MVMFGSGVAVKEPSRRDKRKAMQREASVRAHMKDSDFLGKAPESAYLSSTRDDPAPEGKREPQEFVYEKPTAPDMKKKEAAEAQHERDEGRRMLIANVFDYGDAVDAVKYWGQKNDIPEDMLYQYYPDPSLLATGKEFVLPKNRGKKGSVSEKLYDVQEQVRRETRLQIKELKKSNKTIGEIYSSAYENVIFPFSEGTVASVDFEYGRYTARNRIQQVSNLAGRITADFAMGLGIKHLFAMKPLAKLSGLVHRGFGKAFPHVETAATKVIGQKYGPRLAAQVVGAAARVPKMSTAGALWNATDEHLSGNDWKLGAIYGAVAAPVMMYGMSAGSHVTGRGLGALADVSGASFLMKRVSNWMLGVQNFTLLEKKLIVESATKAGERGAAAVKHFVGVAENTLNGLDPKVDSDAAASAWAVVAANGPVGDVPIKGGEFVGAGKPKKTPKKKPNIDDARKETNDQLDTLEDAPLEIGETDNYNVDESLPYTLASPKSVELDKAATTMFDGGLAIYRNNTFNTASDVVSKDAATKGMQAHRAEMAKLEGQRPAAGVKVKGAKNRVKAVSTLLEDEGAVVASSKSYDWRDDDSRIKQFVGALKIVNDSIKRAPKTVDHFVRKDIRERVTDPMRKALKKYGLDTDIVKRLNDKTLTKEEMAALADTAQAKELMHIGRGGDTPRLEDTVSFRDYRSTRELRGAGVSGEEDIRSINELLKLEDISKQGINAYEADLVLAGTGNDMARRAYFKQRAFDGMNQNRTLSKKQADVDATDITPYTELKFETQTGGGREERYKSTDTQLEDKISTEEFAVRELLNKWMDTGVIKKQKAMLPAPKSREGQLGFRTAGRKTKEFKPSELSTVKKNKAKGIVEPKKPKIVKESKRALARRNVTKARDDAMKTIGQYVTALGEKGTEDQFKLVSKLTNSITRAYESGNIGSIKTYQEMVRSRIKRLSIKPKIVRKKRGRKT